MVRRRSGGNKNFKGSKPRPTDRKDSSIKRWNRAEDIPLDEEDQFHASRDQILLEGNVAQYEHEEDDEDEIFALKGMPESDEEENGEEEYGEEDEDMDGEPERPSKKPKSKKSSSKKSQAESSSSESESEEEEESWGHKKSAYYSSNAAQIESEDEEANEMEEQEAKRLQTKSREQLGDDDFGLGDVPAETTHEEIFEPQLEEASSAAKHSLPTDKKSLIRHLEKTSPETLALARDWEDIAHQLVATREKVQRLKDENADGVILGMAHLHYQALLTYSTTLAFYLHLRSKPERAQNPSSLQSHPILERLLTLKQALATLEELDFDASDDEDDEDIDDFDLYDDYDEEDDMQNLWRVEKKKGLESGELDGLLGELTDEEDETAKRKRQKEVKKDLQGFAEALKALEYNPAKLAKGQGAGEPPKKKLKTSKKAAVPQHVHFDLEEPTFTPSTKGLASSSTPDVDMADVYGEATSLAHSDAQDKNARKKSLKFYTSKVESTFARREGARRALGGDDDVPYRERRKEKGAKAKAVENARKKAQEGGDDLDDVEPEPGAKRKRDRAEDVEEDMEDEGGYYDLVRKKSKEKKEKKKQEYEAARAAERPDFEEDGADGPRALTRAILKNRGLTPHRSKSVRNPRVKKRQKYDQAKKKVASQKAIYKGGMDASRYEGEKSGISKVVKSVRL